MQLTAAEDRQNSSHNCPESASPYYRCEFCFVLFLRKGNASLNDHINTLERKATPSSKYDFIFLLTPSRQSWLRKQHNTSTTVQALAAPSKLARCTPSQCRRDPGPRSHDSQVKCVRQPVCLAFARAGLRAAPFHAPRTSTDPGPQSA